MSATLQAHPLKPFVIFQSTPQPCLFQLHQLPSSQTHSLVKSQRRLVAGGLRLLSRWTLSSLACGWQIHSDFFPAFRFTLSGWNEVWQIFAIYHRSSAQFSGEASGVRPHRASRSLTRNWILKKCENVCAFLTNENNFHFSMILRPLFQRFVPHINSWVNVEGAKNTSHTTPRPKKRARKWKLTTTSPGRSFSVAWKIY